MDRRATALTVLPLALAGALVSHALAYLIAHPDPRLRDAALSGHGYLGLVSTLVVPAAAFTGLAVAIRMTRRLGACPSVGVIVAAQSGLFIAQEVLERVPTGAVDELTREPAIAIGLLLQVPVAVAVVALLRLGRRVVDSAARLGERPRLHLRVTLLELERPSRRLVPAPVRSSATRRGPPRSSI